MTFNIAHARGPSPVHQSLRSRERLRANLLKIARLITRFHVDLVALQEIDQDSRWSGSFDHLQFLSEHSGLPYTAYGLTNRRGGPFHLNYGNAILSKHVIHQCESVAFGRRTVGEKGFLFAEVDTPSGRIPICNIHLNHHSRPIRLRQAEKVMEFLNEQRKHRHPHWRMSPFICGDLNNPATKPDATAVLLGYLEQTENYILLPKGRSANTFPSLWPSRALDYVYLPAACTDISAVVLRSYLSDHRPVLVEFRLPSQ